MNTATMAQKLSGKAQWHYLSQLPGTISSCYLFGPVHLHLEWFEIGET